MRLLSRIHLTGVLLVFASLSSVPAEAATLIGDTVRMQHFFPDTTTIFSGRDITTEVVANPNATDIAHFGAININVESDQVLFTRNQNADIAEGTGTNPCNCMVVSDIDWVGEPSLEIQSVTVTLTFVQSVSVSFDARSVTADFSGNQGDTGEELTVMLNVNPAPTPVPALSKRLLGMLVAMLVGSAAIVVQRGSLRRRSSLTSG